MSSTTDAAGTLPSDFVAPACSIAALASFIFAARTANHARLTCTSCASGLAPQFTTDVLLSPTQFTGLLVTACAVIAGLGFAWLAASHLALIAIEHGHRGFLLTAAQKLATPAIRRALASSILASTLVASPALAAEPPANPPQQTATIADIGWGSPALATFLAPSESPAPHDGIMPVKASEPAARSTIVVQPNDTLWSLAAAHLPPEADATHVAAALAAWIDANPQLTSPNLIYPNQILTIPKEYQI